MDISTISPLLNRSNARVAITSACNLSCSYCGGASGFGRQTPGAMEDFRRKPLGDGAISTGECAEIINSLHSAGFQGVTLTGGEPLLNPNWDSIVNECAAIGMSRVELTTNGTLLSAYLRKKTKMPEGLTLLKVSLDTDDPSRFRQITRNGDLALVMEGIVAVKRASPGLRVRANKVLLRSDMPSLLRYVHFCEKLGIDEITFLDLVLHNANGTEERFFFQKEFIPISGVYDFLLPYSNSGFVSSRYGFETVLDAKTHISLKDSDLTYRMEPCSECPCYCQEGLYTVRVATDGTITPCPDYRAQLLRIDGLSELTQGTLQLRTNELAYLFRTATEAHTFQEFLKRNRVVLVPNVTGQVIP